MKKEQQKYIAIGIGVLFFIFVYFKFLLGPINKGIIEKKQKSDELEQRLETAKKLASELDYLREKSRLLEMEVADLQKQLPKSKDIPDLLRRTTKNAERFGIKIGNFQPQGVAGKAEYDELPFMMTITSDYHSLAHFFAEIGQEERLLSIRNLNLNTMATENKSITVSGSFTMIAFMAKGGQ